MQSSRESSPALDSPTQAAEVEAPMPAHGSMHQRSLSLSDFTDECPSKRAKGRVSGPVALAEMVSGLRELASSLAAPSAGPYTPDRRKKAIQTFQADPEFTDEERLKGVILFHKDISAADVYMALDDKKLRSEFIRSQIN